MKNIIFDVDGTLWDSTDVVADSWNAAIRDTVGIEANLDGDRLKQLFGKTMDEIGLAMLPMLDKKKEMKYVLCAINTKMNICSTIPAYFIMV